MLLQRAPEVEAGEQPKPRGLPKRWRRAAVNVIDSVRILSLTDCLCNFLHPGHPPNILPLYHLRVHSAAALIVVTPQSAMVCLLLSFKMSEYLQSLHVPPRWRALLVLLWHISVRNNTAAQELCFLICEMLSIQGLAA